MQNHLVKCTLNDKGCVYVQSLGDVKTGAVHVYNETPVVVPNGYTHYFNMAKIMWGIRTKVENGHIFFQIFKDDKASDWYKQKECRKPFWEFATSFVPDMKGKKGNNVMIWLGVFYPNVQRLIQQSNPTEYAKHVKSYSISPEEAKAAETLISLAVKRVYDSSKLPIKKRMSMSN
jgi:hypothetical protein